MDDLHFVPGYSTIKPSEINERTSDTWTDDHAERYAKYVKRLIAVRACGEYCVLATSGEEAGQYILILCNAIGSPVDSKYIEVEPQYVTMTPYHVMAG